MLLFVLGQKAMYFDLAERAAGPNLSTIKDIWAREIGKRTRFDWSVNLCADGVLAMTKLRAGDWVEVRSKEEILRTLDKNGRLEGLPFMPQMFEYCGKRFRVYKRAHKTCDTINPLLAVDLPMEFISNLRCDGKAYGGCQAACLIFWKAAWLKPVDVGEAFRDSSPHNALLAPDLAVNANLCTEADVSNATSTPDPEAKDGKRYICQATQLLLYTTPLQMVRF